jgi:hypothetical protein
MPKAYGFFVRRRERLRKVGLEVAIL